MKIRIATWALLLFVSSVTAFAEGENTVEFTAIKPGSRLVLKDSYYTGWTVLHMNRFMHPNSNDVYIGGLNDVNGLEYDGKVGPALYTITASYDSTGSERNFKGHFVVRGAQNNRLILTYDKDTEGNFETVKSNVQAGTEFKVNCTATLLKFGFVRPCTVDDFVMVIEAVHGKTDIGNQN